MGTDGCNGIEGWFVDYIYVYNCATLAVEDVQKQNGIQIYPNPTSGFVTIQNSKNSNLKEDVEIYNIAGQLIQRFNMNNAKNVLLDMSQLLNGIFIPLQF